VSLTDPASWNKARRHRRPGGSARSAPGWRTSLEAQAHGLVEAWRRIIDQAAAMAPYEGMRTVLAGFADLFAARPLLVALTLHEALGGRRTLPLPTAEMVPFPELRALYGRGQHQGVFRADCRSRSPAASP
jgi:hypothetical protein